MKQALSDKSLADVCEAIIGAALVSHVESGYCEETAFDNAVKAVSVLARNDEYKQHNYMQRWTDYYETYEVPLYLTAPSSELQRVLGREVETKHAYHFQQPRLLWSAFLHPSLPVFREQLPSYQRLEFLGDSLLDMVAVTYLFYKYPKKDPQWLTEHKMAIVSNKFQGALCVRIGLHKHLRHEDAKIGRQIAVYVQDIEEAEQEAEGARDYWTAVKSPPKVGLESPCIPGSLLT